jgi:hypothetical protein
MGLNSISVQTSGCVFFLCGVAVMPSLVPDHETYIVLDDFGALGRVWRETDEDAADRATLIRDILKGQYESPVRIVR